MNVSSSYKAKNFNSFKILLHAVSCVKVNFLPEQSNKLTKAVATQHTNSYSSNQIKIIIVLAINNSKFTHKFIHYIMQRYVHKHDCTYIFNGICLST